MPPSAALLKPHTRLNSDSFALPGRASVGVAAHHAWYSASLRMASSAAAICFTVFMAHTLLVLDSVVLLHVACFSNTYTAMTSAAAAAESSWG